MSARLGLAAVLLACLMTPFALRAEDGFETSVAPLLNRHCAACHGELKEEGELRLDTLGHDFSNARQAARWRDVADRVRLGEMPPEDRPRMPAEDAKRIVEWINQQLATVEPGRGHWAFQPVPKASDNTPPRVADANGWVRNDVDRFVLAKLEGAGLGPSPEADRVTLLRRVTFDLIGLPPTPDEVKAFVEDESPGAWERVIDRLQASPHYGERWGRHWLDLAQYADSSGFHNDLDRPYAWKYRDYVIRSFNDDKPYARFVAEQLAGDEIDGGNDESLIATGFCRNGPSNDDNMGKTPEALAQYRADQLDNLISTTGTVFLGMTVGCARCHNHKTEPLTTRDYYSLVAVFNGTQKYGLVPGTEDEKGAKVKVDPAIQIMGLVEQSATPPPTFVLRRGIAANVGEQVEPAVPAALTAGPLEFPKPDPAGKSSLRRRTLAEWITSPDNPLAWRVLANRLWQHHFGKGIVDTPSNFGVSGSAPTHPELLDWLARELIANGGRIKPLHKLLLMSATYRQSSRHRDDAAKVDPTNRLLWRMNLRRLEAEVLRDSILAASGKLNLQGGGPGIKPRVRAELLTASQRNKWPVVTEENEKHWRRSVYIYSKRQLLMPMMELFDAPTTTDSCSVRLASVVPTQALLLMNDEFVEDQAGYLAERAVAEAGSDLSSVVQRMFVRAVAREPGGERLRKALDFVGQREAENGREAALTDLAHVLLNSSEFLYVE
ncbi:MAG TPA: PSD1 and planctomycete cytochrome C domain-containing protein [Caulifigura sp.]|nr:PSD1 and planctomycete cytochrome C domain-containing protein [Caulifigura sp.]